MKQSRIEAKPIEAKHWNRAYFAKSPNTENRCYYSFKMTSFNLANVSEALQDVSNDNSGVSFAGLAKKWENEDDGKNQNKQTCF